MALQHVEGTIYKIVYRDVNFSTQNITIVGSYSPEVVWALAECLVDCVKATWFSDETSVIIDRIESIGETSEVAQP